MNATNVETANNALLIKIVNWQSNVVAPGLFLFCYSSRILPVLVDNISKMLFSPVSEILDGIGALTN